MLPLSESFVAPPFFFLLGSVLFSPLTPLPLRLGGAEPGPLFFCDFRPADSAFALVRCLKTPYDPPSCPFFVSISSLRVFSARPTSPDLLFVFCFCSLCRPPLNSVVSHFFFLARNPPPLVFIPLLSFVVSVITQAVIRISLPLPRVLKGRRRFYALLFEDFPLFFESGVSTFSCI